MVEDCSTSSKSRKQGNDMSLDKLRNLKARIQSRDGFWIEKLKLDFTKALSAQMRRKNIKKGELAKKLDLSAPYITKVMRGEENLTIESMVKLARATGGQMHLHISDIHSSVSWIECTANGTFRDMMEEFSNDSHSVRVQKNATVKIVGDREPGDVPA